MQGLWIDAYWYDGGFWYGNGNYTWPPELGVDRTRFPNGVRPVADRCHESNLTFFVWFEPERVMPGTWIERHYPSYLQPKKSHLQPKKSYLQPKKPYRHPKKSYPQPTQQHGTDDSSYTTGGS